MAPYVAAMRRSPAVDLRPRPGPADGGVRRQARPGSSPSTTPGCASSTSATGTGLTTTSTPRLHPEEYRAFRAGHYDVVPGGETTPTVVARMVAALAKRWPRSAPGECGVVVSHGAALKVSLSALLGWPDGAASTLQGLDNCGWAVLDDSGGPGRLRLAAYNRAADPGRPRFRVRGAALARIPRVVSTGSTGADMGLWRSW